MPDNALSDITHTIQLAVAPVFLLTAIGTTLSVLVTRLARIIDRARTLEYRFGSAPVKEQRRIRAELDQLSHRARIIHASLTAGVASALSVCLLIMIAFIGYLTQTNLGQPVAVLFILSMGLLVLTLVSFLSEIFVSVKSLQFGLYATLREPESATAPETPDDPDA